MLAEHGIAYLFLGKELGVRSDDPSCYVGGKVQYSRLAATGLFKSGSKRVLEVSCGHGGGASYLTRTLHPATYTGLDLNTVGIEFCRKRHNLPGLDLLTGGERDRERHVDVIADHLHEA